MVKRIRASVSRLARYGPSLGVAMVAAALSVANAAAADEFPALKAGQWEVLTIPGNAVAGAPANKTTVCTDQTIQNEIMALGSGMSRDMCSKMEIKREASRVVTNAECKIGESNIKSRAVMTLSGDTGYNTEIIATYDPPFMNMRESKTTLVGKYVGPCRDGLVPGDFVTANGRKFNLKGLAQRKPMVAPPATEPKK